MIVIVLVPCTLYLVHQSLTCLDAMSFLSKNMVDSELGLTYYYE